MRSSVWLFHIHQEAFELHLNARVMIGCAEVNETKGLEYVILKRAKIWANGRSTDFGFGLVFFGHYNFIIYKNPKVFLKKKKRTSI